MPTPPRFPDRPVPPARGGRPHQPGRAPGRRPTGATAVRRGGVGRWAMRAATTLSVLVLMTAGVGHAVVTGLGEGIERVAPLDDTKDRPAAGRGTNVLLVGTDGRAGVGARERRAYRLGGTPCHCTDTIMIVHLSADRDRVSVVSLPRDSYAHVPAHRDRATGRWLPSHPVKLNAAYAEGGPQLTVRTVEHMTRVTIDHYLEVDFTAFMKTVDQLGGVQICTPERLVDSHTGLDLNAGRHRLTGGQALQYVRSRHVDGEADLGRMARQQRFLAALVAQARSSGVLLNPPKLADLVRTVLGSVRADPDLGPEDLLDLGRAMHGLTPASTEFATVPLRDTGHRVKGLGTTVRWDTARAEHLFAALRADRPLVRGPTTQRAAIVPVAPAQIRVQVVNGGSAPDLGTRVDGALRAAGFATTGTPVDSEQRARRTVVLHDPRWDRSAASLAAALPGSTLRPVPGQGAVLKVVAGSDFQGIRRVRAADPGSRRPDAVTGDQVACS